jgi:drug/metabolite transporter (DMT)-like permease
MEKDGEVPLLQHDDEEKKDERIGQSSSLFGFREATLAHIGMIFVSLTFSIFNVLAKKVSNNGLDPIIFAFFREVGSSIVLLTVCKVTVGWPRPSTRQDCMQIIACGFTGIYGLQLFYTLGLWNSTSETTAIFQLATPILVVIFAALSGILLPRRPSSGDEKIMESYCLCGMLAVGFESYRLCPDSRANDNECCRSWTKLLGVLLGLFGLACLTGAKKLEASFAGDASAKGDLFLLISDIVGSWWILLLKPLYGRYHPTVLAAYNYTVGAVFMVVTAVVLRHDRHYWHLTTSDIAVLAYAILVCSSFNYAVMTWANKFIEGTVFSLYGGLQPIFTAVLAYFVLGEQPALSNLYGGLLICLGLMLTSYSQSQSGKEEVDQEAIEQQGPGGLTKRTRR